MPSVNTRVFFSKLGRAKYISHLDLSHCVIRAIRRSRLPVWQTEGFNPHTYVAFMLPLSLGQEGECEAMDIRLVEDIPPEEVISRLNSALPPDIRVIRVAAPVRKSGDIAYAEYRIEGGIDTEKLREFLGSDSIPAEKKTKRGSSVIDLKPLIREVVFGEGAVSLRLPAGNELSVNPSLLLEVYSAATGENVSGLRIVRTHAFCADGSEFC